MHAYRIAYDGRSYHGFQRQPNVPTVEDAILDALRDLDVLDENADVPRGYAAAGRTDAGVSAVAQTVAFEAPEWLSPAALDAELPADVRAWAMADAPADFHATHDSLAREYTYFLYAPDADDALARAALEGFASEHDFHNLTPDDAGTVRELRTALERDGDFLVARLRAGGFARQLVRRIVSVVAAVAGGEASLDRVERVLSAERLDGPEGVAPAPAQPLVLTAVEYPGIDFVEDEDAVASARDVFEGRRVARLTGARVATALREGVGDD